MKSERSESEHGGIEAAASLLKLLGRRSATELREAALILGGDPEIVRAIELLCSFKKQLHRRRPTNGSSSAVRRDERLRELRMRLREEQQNKEIEESLAARNFASLSMSTDEESPFSENKIHFMVFEVLRDAPIPLNRVVELYQHWSEVPPLDPRQSRSMVAANLLSSFRNSVLSPVTRKVGYIRMLFEVARYLPNPGYPTNLARNMIIDGLANETRVSWSLDDIAHLREIWASSPLKFTENDSREQLVQRLLEDFDRSVNAESQEDVLLKLLQQAVRRPSDGPIAVGRILNKRKTL